MHLNMDGLLSQVSAPMAVVVVLVGVYLLHQAALPQPIPGIPYHKASANSILGDIMSLISYNNKPGGAISWFYDQFTELDSPIVQVFIRPLGRPLVFISDFKEADEVLKRRTGEFDRSNFLGDFLRGVAPDHHISMPTGPKFKYNRQLVADTMSPAFINEVAAPHIHKATVELVRLWTVKSELARGHAFEASDDLNSTSLDAMWAATFGKELGVTTGLAQLLSYEDLITAPKNLDSPVVFTKAIKPPAADAIVTILDTLENLAGSPFPSKHHWFLRQSRSYKKATSHKTELVLNIIDEAEDRLKKNDQASIRSAVDLMLQRELRAAKKNGRLPEYRSPAAQDELFGFLIAGHETTTTTMSWALKMLADNPLIQQKLRQELETEFSAAADAATNPTARDIALSGAAYLHATVEEILRCSYTITTLSRVAKQDTQVLGHHIPKGTDVFFMNNGPGFMKPGFAIDESKRNSRSLKAKDQYGTWDESDMGVFKPERWLKNDEKGNVEFDAHAGPSLPFGGGPRGCFGKKLAYLEMRTLIVLLVWNFEFHAAPPGLSGYTLVPKLTNPPMHCFVKITPVERGEKRSGGLE